METRYLTNISGKSLILLLYQNCQNRVRFPLPAHFSEYVSSRAFGSCFCFILANFLASKYSSKHIIFLGLLLMVCFFSLFLAWPIKWTWNYVIPYLFNLPTITWGHAWCLNFLAGCLIQSSLSYTK